jgi:hypothetical protein
MSGQELFIIFLHSISCQAMERAQAYSVQHSLVSVCLQIEMSISGSTGPYSIQLSHQLQWSPPAVTREGPIWENIPDAHPTSLGWFFEVVPAKSL